MEKFAALKSSEIPEKFSIFKMHLGFLERGWLKKNYVSVETYQSSMGHIYSCILHRDEAKQIERMDYLIDDAATLEEIDVFLDEVLTDKNIANLSGWIQMNLQSKHFDYVFNDVNKRIGSKYGDDPEKWDHNILIAPVSKPEEIAVPQGYTLGPLLECHVESITARWELDTGISMKKISPDSSKSITVMTNITQRPSFGIFTESEPSTPIAWIAVYPGGCVGMLHVLEGHQRKGLARILIRNTLRVIQNTYGMSYRAHTCAKRVNIPSLNLFLSEGWELQPYCNKKMFFRTTGLSGQ